MSRASYRAAAVQLLRDYGTDAGIKLQVYPGRPRSVNAPAAFVDRIVEGRIDYSGPVIVSRSPSVEVVVLHGLFDSADTVDQADAFVDGFLTWARTRYHAAGANTTIGVTGAEDDPTYVTDWQPPEVQRTYYSTRLTLEGFDSTN